MPSVAAAASHGDQPFSFTELFAAQADEGKDAKQDAEKATIVASDGVELAITIYEPPTASATSTALLFYHGGGAHSGAGYQLLARGLAENFGISVYLPDLRGHGASDGPRGDAPSKEQIWNDIDHTIVYVSAREQQKQPESTHKLFLGGHSSGGGLVVNYATEHSDKGMFDIEGYILISPELGYNSKTARPDRRDFAKVNILTFIANGIFGILGHSKAVQFNYPPELLENDKGMVGFNTVLMANAITPETPMKQMQAMATGKIPIGLWVGSDDELFVAEKVAEFIPRPEQNASSHSSNVGEVVPGKDHLGILVGVYERVGLWITNLKETVHA